MNISNATSSPVVPTALSVTSPVQGISTSGTQSQLSSASIVNISALGNFLSAAANLGDNLSQQAGNLPASYNTFIANTQFFVDALNRLLASNNSTQNSSGASFLTQFMQVLNSSTNAASGNGLSIFSNLASIGITLQSPTSAHDYTQIQLNPQLLQSAFNANSIGTSSLLGLAFQSIGKLASNMATQFLQLEMNLAQASSLQNALAATPLNTSTVNATVPTATSVAANLTAQPTVPAQSATPVAIFNAATITNNNSPTIATQVSTAANSATIATPVTAAANNAATTITTADVVSAFNAATDSTTAAAIAAYHLVSGMFDTGKSSPAKRLPAASYSQIWPLARVQPVSPS